MPGDVSFEPICLAAKATGRRAAARVAAIDQCRISAQVGDLIVQALASRGAVRIHAGHARAGAVLVRPAVIWMLSADAAVAAVAMPGDVDHSRSIHRTYQAKRGFLRCIEDGDCYLRPQEHGPVRRQRRREAGCPAGDAAVTGPYDALVVELLAACDSLAAAMDQTLSLTSELAEAAISESAPSVASAERALQQVEAHQAQLAKFRTLVAQYKNLVKVH